LFCCVFFFNTSRTRVIMSDAQAIRLYE
jgi:hypothetical protein